MPITPIDLATVAPKSQETFIAKQPEVQKPLTDLANANVQTEQKVQKQSDTVTVLHKGDNLEYRYDAKDGSGNSASYSGGQNHQRKQKNSAPKTEYEKKIGQGIDIRI